MEPVCFFAVGDIGQTGQNRRSVAAAIHRLNSESKLKCGFVVTTGDNIYGSAPLEPALASLAADMMDSVPVPWFFTAGNHDVKGDKFAWHVRNNNAKGEAAGWTFCFPSPAYSVSEQRPDLTRGLLDVIVINTNKFQCGWPRGGAPPASSPGFYTAYDRHWWKEQKQQLARRLQASSSAWNIVIGHHPAEYVKYSFTEHSLPITRYFKTTFMRGGADSRRDRQALNHILRRDADVYMCGHQHLMAHMKLSASGSSRPHNETRCDFVIMGNSSRLDQDAEDSDDGSSDGGAMAVEPAGADAVDGGRNARFSEEWVQQGRLGFLRVIADALCLRVQFYTVDAESQACRLVHEVTKRK